MLRLVALIVVAGCGVELGAPSESQQNTRVDAGTTPAQADAAPTPTTPPAPAMTPATFLSKLGTKYCDECFRCKATYPPGLTAFNADFGTTITQCYAGMDAYYMAPSVEASIAAGRITFDATAAATCIAGIVYPPSCTNFWQTDTTYPAACSTAMVGKIADGGTCTNDYDCIGTRSVCPTATKRCTAT